MRNENGQRLNGKTPGVGLEITIAGRRRRGGSRKSWQEETMHDIRLLGLHRGREEKP